MKYSGTTWGAGKSSALGRAKTSPILLFHRVCDLASTDPLTVPPERFKAMCKLLASSFRVVPLARVFEWVQAKLPLPERTVAITFDDCYQDNLHAAHILAEFGLPATFFIPTTFVGTDHTFSWDHHLPRLPNLNWNDLYTIQQLGHEIGSHSVTHPNMGILDPVRPSRNSRSPRRPWKKIWAGRAACLLIPSGARPTGSPSGTIWSGRRVIWERCLGTEALSVQRVRRDFCCRANRCLPSPAC